MCNRSIVPSSKCGSASSKVERTRCEKKRRNADRERLRTHCRRPPNKNLRVHHPSRCQPQSRTSLDPNFLQTGTSLNRTRPYGSRARRLYAAVAHAPAKRRMGHVRSTPSALDAQRAKACYTEIEGLSDLRRDEQSFRFQGVISRRSFRSNAARCPRSCPTADAASFFHTGLLSVVNKAVEVGTVN